MKNFFLIEYSSWNESTKSKYNCSFSELCLYILLTRSLANCPWNSSTLQSETDVGLCHLFCISWGCQFVWVFFFSVLAPPLHLFKTCITYSELFKNACHWVEKLLWVHSCENSIQGINSKPEVSSTTCRILSNQWA